MALNFKKISKENETREPLFHVVKRAAMPFWQSMAIRAGAVLVAFLVCTLLSSLLIGKTPMEFLSTFFNGILGSPSRRLPIS